MGSILTPLSSKKPSFHNVPNASVSQDPPTSCSTTIAIRLSPISFPDIVLTTPYNLKIRKLKSRIRQRLPEDQKTRGLRLIHGGRLLNDEWSVGVALRLKEPDVSIRKMDAKFNDFDTDIHSGIGKGKAKMSLIGENAFSRSQDVVYLHCSVSSEPIPAHILALETEADAEEHMDTTWSAEAVEGLANTPKTSIGPLGFDLLLSNSTAFTPADVASLRAQFSSVIASRHTPDTMPSPGRLRRMEESWLSTESFTRSTTSAGVEVEGIATRPGDEDDASASMQDSFIGVVCGFFWPLGSLIWGLRENGVWSRRRGFAVLAGIGVNVGFGLVKILS